MATVAMGGGPVSDDFEISELVATHSLALTRCLDKFQAAIHAGT